MNFFDRTKKILLDEIERKIKKIKKDIEDNENKLNEAKSEIDELNSIKEQISEDIKRFKEPFKEPFKETLKKTFKKALKKTINNINSNREKINKLEAELNKCKKSITQINQQIKKINVKLNKLSIQMQDLNKKKKKIEEAQTLAELGFESKAEVVKKYKEKLKDTKDYIVIPIPNEIENISDLFNEEKIAKVQINGKTFYTTYSREIATGRINFIHDLENLMAALMIPIKGLEEQDIDSVRSGEIRVNKSALRLKEIVMIIQENSKINVDTENIQKINTNSIGEAIKNFLGDDLTDSDESVNYKIFKGKPDISQDEQEKEKEAIKNCLFENVLNKIAYEHEIKVNEKRYYLQNNDVDDINKKRTSNVINEKNVQTIANDIEKYLNEQDKSSANIDDVYKRLMLEYLRVVPKSKAIYYEEDNKIDLQGEKLSIKLPLPPKNETIAKRYTRPNENIAYKMMILAKLVNKFAHLMKKRNSPNKQLEEQLFTVKLNLIEKVIELSQKDTNIKIMKQFDYNKMLKGIIVEIPGYTMISLHVRNEKKQLRYKTNRLNVFEGKIVKTSDIILPGVNDQLLIKLKELTIEERIQALINLDDTTFYKLAIRMGYTSDTITTQKDKREFIRQMISDKKLDELLEQNSVWRDD